MSNDLYAPLIERDLGAVPDAVRRYRQSHSSDDLWLAVTRFAVLAFAPSLHGESALLACLAAHELREELADRFDDVVTECAIYAAASRQPWSEPPILDPPPLADDQRTDVNELRAAVATSDRLRAERWLAAALHQPQLASDLFTIACDHFDALGQQLIFAASVWRLAPLLGEQGRFATLRTIVWELTARKPAERYEEDGIALDAATLFDRLVDNAVADDGSPVSAQNVFLLDAALEAADVTNDRGIARRVRDYLTSCTSDRAVAESIALDAPRTIPVYRLGRDYAQALRAFALARRMRARFGDGKVDRFVAAACYNLAHGPSFEEFAFA